MLNKAMHKTRLTQKQESKHTQVMQNQKQERGRERERERERKWLNHLEPFSFHTLKEPFLLVNPGSDGEGKDLKPFKFERYMRVLSRSPRGAKKDGNWFWFLDEIIPLLCWVDNHL